MVWTKCQDCTLTEVWGWISQFKTNRLIPHVQCHMPVTLHVGTHSLPESCNWYGSIPFGVSYSRLLQKTWTHYVRICWCCPSQTEETQLAVEPPHPLRTKQTQPSNARHGRYIWHETKASQLPKVDQWKTAKIKSRWLEHPRPSSCTLRLCICTKLWLLKCRWHAMCVFVWPHVLSGGPGRYKSEPKVKGLALAWGDSFALDEVITASWHMIK